MVKRSTPLVYAYLLVLALVAPSLGADYLNGTVTKVRDGDTIEITDSGEKYVVRFYGIDAPESAQPFGSAAKEFVEKAIGGKSITVLVLDNDSYGRSVGDVLVDGKSLNRELVKNGLAWWFKQYAEDDQDLQKLEAAARVGKFGLWAQDKPQAPWGFRKNGPSETDEPLVPEGPEGRELMELLRSRHQLTKSLSYREAREAMFGQVDNHDGKVTLFYTGVEFLTAGIPNPNQVNTEHIWPQSYFKRRSPMRSDLHHLAPTYSRVNSARGRSPFAEIPDSETDKWWGDEIQSPTPPEEGPARDALSESTSNEFEPREDRKGDVARALLYVYTVHGERGITPGWLLPQLPTLTQWHALDPPDDRERERNGRIESVQGNRNRV